MIIIKRLPKLSLTKELLKLAESLAQTEDLKWYLIEAKMYRESFDSNRRV